MNDEQFREEILKMPGPIVVFGAAGFLGSNLCRKILEVRNDCYAVNHRHYLTWRLTGLPVANIIYADLLNPASIAKIFDKFGFKTIFNFAAYGAYSKQHDMKLIYSTNVLGTMNLLEAAREKGFAAYVHAGSSSEYGLNCQGPSENSELSPNSHYAVSKVSSSYMIKFYGKISKLPVINLRYYSVYGPYEEPDRLIPVIIENAATKKLPPLVDPEISRDFIYVDDALQATVLAATRGVKQLAGESLNIGTGQKTSIRELITTVKDTFQIKEEPKWSSMPNRFWDLQNWYGNVTSSEQNLNWKARTSLKEGLLKTYQWREAQKIAPPSEVMMGQPVRISAVIACYKDGQAIPEMHASLSRVFSEMRVDYEIIFVNDASPDESAEVLEKITSEDNHVIAIEHSRNFGSQNAFLSGMQIATGDAVVLLDGDLQDPPEVIPAFYQKWKEGYEVVYGRRTKRIGSKLLGICYKIFYRLLRQVSYVPIPLDAGDFSLMDRKVVNELLALPETEQFLRGLRAWVGFKQTGVDYTRPERRYGKSTNDWRKNIGWAKKAIFSFSFAPLEIISSLGIILTVIALVAMVADIIAKILWPNVPHGITTIIILILFFGGVQMLAISIIGEYIIKIFEETKKRPKFIRKFIRHGQQRLNDDEQIREFVRKRRADGAS
jgi:polyisoprenyl-phosphate glycosyltransferase